MSNKNSTRFEGGPAPLDESWWAAVLSDEEEMGANSFPGKHPASTPPENKTAVPRVSSKPGQVDWDQVQEIYENDESITLQVVGHNRGGLLVEGPGLQGFVPLSHLVDLAGEKVESLEGQRTIDPLLAAYVGRKLHLKVIECEPERGRIVLSERAALAEPGRRNLLLDTLKTGECVRGIVTNVTDFGVFVDLGGVEGLIHVSELSWGRVRHPSDAASVGDEVQAYVIKVEKDRSRVALSLKRLRANPWDTAEERYHPGQVTEAVVTSIVPFGAFARLEEGLDGLIHISEMNQNGEKIEPTHLLQEGQSIMVRVLHVDAPKQRLGLSLCLNKE